MKRFIQTLLSIGAFLAPAIAARSADDFKLEEGYTLLFNGKDLTGWEYGYVPPAMKPNIEKLDGKTASTDKVFLVADGLLVASGKSVRAIYTAKEYNADFHLKFEFRTAEMKKKNNSGLFLRGPQLQLDATNQGGLTNVFKNIKNFKEDDWNEIDVTVKGTEATCQCNGESIGKPMKIPAKGTIGLQSEFGKFEFRRIRIKEL